MYFDTCELLNNVEGSYTFKFFLNKEKCINGEISIIDILYLMKGDISNNHFVFKLSDYSIIVGGLDKKQSYQLIWNLCQRDLIPFNMFFTLCNKL